MNRNNAGLLPGLGSDALLPFSNPRDSEFPDSTSSPPLTPSHQVSRSPSPLTIFPGSTSFPYSSPPSTPSVSYTLEPISPPSPPPPVWAEEEPNLRLYSPEPILYNLVVPDITLLIDFLKVRILPHLVFPVQGCPICARLVH